MAKQVKLVDDLDGSDAVETVRFALRGEAYEIDLNQKNADALTKALEKYITAARAPESGSYEHPLARRRGRPAGSTNRAPAATRDFDPKEIRGWATTQGIVVSPRGRIPAELVEKWKAATQSS